MPPLSYSGIPFIFTGRAPRLFFLLLTISTFLALFHDFKIISAYLRIFFQRDSHLYSFPPLYHFSIRGPKFRIHNLFIVSLQYISSTQHRLYLLNFQYNIYNYFATCFDSSESSSGIRFKTYCMYCFIASLSYGVFPISKGIPFFALQTRPGRPTYIQNLS